ncbi:S8 family serine peptidase [Tannerella sp.]|uniref:S8 family serine peptidase n=2 Tax=Tannerella sp. TaxID=2382127 RepID=UPI003FA23695
MKRLYLFLILVQITATLFSQSDFFYSKDGKKEVFKIRKDLVVFKTKSPNMQGLNIRTVQFKSLDKLPDGLIKATVDPNQFRQEDFIRSDRVEDAYYMLEYNNAAQLALSNSIFVKPREGETIENVIRKSGLSGKIRENELILPASGISLLTLDCKMKDILSVCRKVYETGTVDFVEPNFYMEAMLGNTYWPKQWTLKNTGQEGGIPGIDINIEPAWRITKGNGNIKIAIVDQGVDLTHPDLEANLLKSLGYDATAPAGQSGTKGGYAGNDGHGTWCAGVVGAVDNSIGVVGVAPKCKMIPIRVFGVYSSEASIIKGLRHAYTSGADVINNSWGSFYNSNVYDAVISECVLRGRSGKGCVVVFCSHNDGKPRVRYPANLPNVMAVGSITNIGQRVSDSNFGDALDVVAPVGGGENDTHTSIRVYTTDLQGAKGKNTAPSPAGDYRHDFNGTSAACPQVVGIAALILSVNPHLYAHEVRSIIEMTCRKLDRYEFKETPNHPNGTWNREVGYGLVDAEAAVQAANCVNSLANNISSNRFARSCRSSFTLRNVTVSNRAKLTVKSPETSVNGTFEVNSGCCFEIR